MHLFHDRTPLLRCATSGLPYSCNVATYGNHAATAPRFSYWRFGIKVVDSIHIGSLSMDMGVLSKSTRLHRSRRQYREPSRLSTWSRECNSLLAGLVVNLNGYALRLWSSGSHSAAFCPPNYFPVTSVTSLFCHFQAPSKPLRATHPLLQFPRFNQIPASFLSFANLCQI